MAGIGPYVTRLLSPSTHIQHMARTFLCSMYSVSTGHAIKAQFSSVSTTYKTAHCIIIGDEVLNGKCHDSNSHHLAKVMFSQGVDLTRIHTIPDEEDVIIQYVRESSANADYVFTSGGIGPTHDDITYPCIAKAFGAELYLHQPTVDAMKASMPKGTEVNDSRKRMALFPTDSILHPTQGLWVPIVQKENVFILPGVPRLFERMIDSNKHLWAGTPSYRAIVHTGKPEGDIAVLLASMAQRVKPHGVAIGSYPKKAQPNSTGPKYRVYVSIEGRNKDVVHQTAVELEGALEGQVIKGVEDGDIPPSHE